MPPHTQAPMHALGHSGPAPTKAISWHLPPDCEAKKYMEYSPEDVSLSVAP